MLCATVVVRMRETKYDQCLSTTYVYLPRFSDHVMEFLKKDYLIPVHKVYLEFIDIVSKDQEYEDSSGKVLNGYVDVQTLMENMKLHLKLITKKRLIYNKVCWNKL